jgi:type IX secretion system PorP/SprF family membrane protein
MKKNLSTYFLRGGFLVLLIAGSFSARAQDFHLSQYDAAPLNLNPSMTGLFEGYYRIHAHYRTQWSAIATNPFQTFAVSFDMPVEKWAFGGQLMDYRAGAGNYNVFSFLGSVGYDYALDKENEYHHISGGVQLGIMQKSINFGKLTWDAQYTNANGGSFNTSLPSQETFANDGMFMPDLNAGFIYYYGKEKSRLNPFIGFAANHLTRPKETFYASDNRLPIRYTIHGGTRVNVNEKLQLLPKFLILRQTNARELTASLVAQYYLAQSDVFLFAGPTFRLSGPLGNKANYYGAENDAAVIDMGMKMGSFIYRLSYDINTSSLQPYTNSRGGLEISVTYTGRRSQPDRIPNCPRL